jgi:small subunit ribosomal protein S20
VSPFKGNQVVTLFDYEHRTDVFWEITFCFIFTLTFGKRPQGVISMPQHKACEKHVRKSKKANLKNRSDWSTLRTVVRTVLDSKDKTTASESLKTAVSFIDKCAGSGLIHKNNASNKKSRLFIHVNKLQGK